ncbi:hypothetical protein ACFWPV_25680 [Streptomyces uncialis]|uniref:hypothetical protein n=1 Tax=Streptomyces uncialis TaxID=1048205 RepID=UPI003662A4A2
MGLTAMLLVERLENAASEQEIDDVVDRHLRLGEHAWKDFVSDLALTLTFGELWPFLWISVLIAVLVRLNPAGPPRLQLALSAATASYCALISVTWLAYLLQLGWWFLLAVGAAGAFIRLVTRR